MSRCDICGYSLHDGMCPDPEHPYRWDDWERGYKAGYTMKSCTPATPSEDWRAGYHVGRTYYKWQRAQREGVN